MITHNSNTMRASDIMLLLQRAKESDMPIEIKVGRDTFNVNTVQEASLISLGMMMTFVMREVEEDEER